MAELKNMNKFKLKSSKFRVIAALVLVVAVVVTLISMWYFKSKENAFKGVANVASLPSIQSIPGAGNPSNAYITAQNTDNATEAQKARKEASSFVTTITQPSFIGSPESFSQNDNNTPTTSTNNTNTSSNSDNFHCPLNNVVYMYRPNPASCTVPNLQLARKA